LDSGGEGDLALVRDHVTADPASVREKDSMWYDPPLTLFEMHVILVLFSPFC
jgi:hypothetical protein